MLNYIGFAFELIGFFLIIFIEVKETSDVAREQNSKEAYRKSPVFRFFTDYGDIDSFDFDDYRDKVRVRIAGSLGFGLTVIVWILLEAISKTEIRKKTINCSPN